jgi:glycine/D-amino acid oxidase-like deaminating enzyme
LRWACLDGGERNSASRAAGGLAYPDQVSSRVPLWWRQTHQLATRAFLVEAGRSTGEWVRGAWRPGLWIVDCSRLLERAGPIRRRVERLWPERGWRACDWTAPWVVLATGVFTDRLLSASGLAEIGVGSLPGRGLLFAGEVAQGTPRTHHYRLPGDTRTRKATVRNWAPAQVRVGDTLEPANLEAQLAVLRALGGEEIAQMVGLRPVLPKLLVEIVRPGVIVATGGHRSGLSTAGGVALRVQELILHGGNL